MKNIKIGLWTLLIGLSVMWALTDNILPEPLTYFTLRGVQVQYTGLIAMAAMSVAMMLAVRPRSLERALHGLDKMYRLHKWLGVTALTFACMHFVWAKGTKWAVGWGWLIKPAKSPADAIELGPIEQLLNNQRGFAEGIGQWVFYLAALLMLAALIKRIPYHWFAKTHTILAGTYLLLVYHCIVLIKFAYWPTTLGGVIALLLLGGSLAALVSLFQRIGARNTVHGKISQLIHYPELNVIEKHIALQAGWTGHKAGQFAFVKVRANEAPHPYTIASDWDPKKAQINFITKGLGDHTRSLPKILHVGNQVTVEGPYGCFTFEDNKKRQIWIGAGIGITPFIARLKHLAKHPDQQHRIDLYHPSNEYSKKAMTQLQQFASDAGVALRLLIKDQNGRLTGERIRLENPDWREASLWFCGPAKFASSLCDDLKAHGLKNADFHQELFQMR